MESHVSRLRSCIHPWTGHTMSARQGEKLFQEIDGSTSSPPDPHTMHSGPMARNSSMIPSMEFYVRCNSGHTRQVDLQSFGRPLYSEQQSEPRQDEPDYDLPTESIPPSPHPSRSDAPHEDEGTAQAKYRMRRPAPPSIEEERKIKPFAKKPHGMHHEVCSMQPMEISSSASWRTGSDLGNPSQTLRGECTSVHGMHRRRHP